MKGGQPGSVALGTLDANSVTFLTNNSARLTINASGNVGIGTTSPGANTKLNVSGQIVSKSHNNGSSGVIDFANGNVVTTAFDCGSDISFANLRDGGSYTLVVTGTGTTPCNFATSVSGDDAATVTYRFTPENGARTPNKHTIYSLLRVGDTVYVSWIAGL